MEMLDFVQTMKNWRRMCKHYSDESMKNGQLSCADMCPLGTNTACGVIEDALDSDIEDMAKAIAQWVEEHPEPVYPTWAEWLTDVGAIPKVISWDEPLVEAVYDALQKPIPADIAEKLGIEPKEGV